ncbi:MAG: IS1634 family transposase [Deltaproteobacteria bacterium]|nr:IS1634 family transposase [Deltaproteobacteria bacterium]
MFVRKKRNRSGAISIQLIDKSHGYRVMRTLGCTADPEEIRRLVQWGKQIIESGDGKQFSLFAKHSKQDHAIENFLSQMRNSQIRTIGPELIFGTLFDRIGFNVISENIFRHITIARLAYPTSKLKTVDYLYRYRGITMSVQNLYRFLDKLSSSYKNQVEKISYEHTKAHLKTISVVFYDMTTLYFEAQDEDDLRKIGFSKDGKFQKPQIMLGLLVGQGGYPIGYDIYEGNTFEGHTLLPTLKKIEEKYGFKNATVIADAALLSKDNLANLSKAQYQFIVGARIKNESKEIQEEILKKAGNLEEADSFIIKKKEDLRLVISYSTKRAKKDAHNRKRGLNKLNKRIKSGRLTKENINNRGYNKFLKLSGEIKVSLDEEKIKEDQKWDGLKGYITNTTLSAKTIIENYKELWQIEKAFRISKTDLKIRPIYHYRKHRIEAHICISFVAYSIYKELEHLLNQARLKMTPKRAAELTHNMYELHYVLPGNPKNKKIPLKMDPEQQIPAALHRLQLKGTRPC